MRFAGTLQAIDGPLTSSVHGPSLPSRVRPRPHRPSLVADAAAGRVVADFSVRPFRAAPAACLAAILGPRVPLRPCDAVCTPTHRKTLGVRLDFQMGNLVSTIGVLCFAVPPTTRSPFSFLCCGVSSVPRLPFSSAFRQTSVSLLPACWASALWRPRVNGIRPRDHDHARAVLAWWITCEQTEPP